MLCILFITVWLCYIPVESLPLTDSGPYLTNDWEKAVRFRHLYTARHGLHLQINSDGQIDGSKIQSSYSLVEIQSVDRGYVVIKGVTSTRFLCMDSKGKLHGSYIYIKEDCSFIEQILPDGFNIYISNKYGTLVKLDSSSKFLPMVNKLSQEPTNQHFLKEHSLQLEQDHQNPFGKIMEIVIHSPSFNKR